MIVRPVASAADRRAFIDVAYRLNADDPNWIAPLRQEVADKIDPGKNAWFTHARAQLFVAEHDGQTTGRIAAHIDELALAQPRAQGFGPGAGHWGMIEAADRATFAALVAAAEDWLRGQGMTRALGPISLSVWEEPGLLIKGFDHPPTVMMGHNREAYRGWLEALGHARVKTLMTYELDITQTLPPLVQRIIASGERNPRIVVRRVDKKRFAEEAAIIMDILNDAWSDNWGFVPLTDPEIEEVGRKLKPIVFEDLIMIAEVEGDPVAFMITLPDLNEALAPLKGKLFPFGWARLLWWLRAPKVRTMRVPLMGVVKRLQSTRLASQLAFMMIEYIRRESVSRYHAKRGEIGWILEDNQGMRAIAETIESRVNREYAIYERALA